ncbi:MAG: DUF1566 domain-containing protein [Desulfurivibrio sp.]
MSNITPSLACWLLLTFFLAGPALAQSCRDSIPATTPGGNFILHDDGTVTHGTTGLMWMRCSLGQSWSDEACNGAAGGFTWGEALRAAVGHQFAGYSDWRLPNKNELEALVEESCSLPAINAAIFPATPTAYFWTSSPYAGLAYAAWSVDFGFGAVNASVKSGSIHLRLVREP